MLHDERSGFRVEATKTDPALQMKKKNIPVWDTGEEASGLKTRMRLPLRGI